MMETCCKLFTNKTLHEKCAARAIHKTIAVRGDCQIFSFIWPGEMLHSNSNEMPKDPGDKTSEPPLERLVFCVQKAVSKIKGSLHSRSGQSNIWRLMAIE